MRYYNRKNHTEHLPDIHPDSADVIELADDHLFFQSVPEGSVLAFTEQGLPVWEKVAPLSLAQQEQALLARVDQAADHARHILAGDLSRAIEYERTASEAQQFAARGYPAADVPPSVAAWAINGRSPEQATLDILTQAKAYEESVYRIRATRLQAKEQIRELLSAAKAAEAEAATEQAEQRILSLVSAAAYSV